MARKQVTLSLSRFETEKVKKVLLEYVEAYKQYSNRQDREDFKLFVSGVTQKISHCLEQDFAIALEWLE